MTTIGLPIMAGLADLCADLLSFALRLRRTKDPGNPESFRLGVEELFNAFDAEAREAGIAEVDAAMAKYALAALIDELVLNSSWPGKASWTDRPLQLQYFNDLSAGEEFFTRLESLRRAQDPKKIDVLEVYYLCLALGFRGKYGDLEGMVQLKTLTNDLAKGISKAREPGGPRLSPQGSQPHELPPIVRSIPVWVIAVGCGTIVFLIYTILFGILSRETNSVIEVLTPFH